MMKVGLTSYVVLSVAWCHGPFHICADVNPDPLNDTTINFHNFMLFKSEGRT